jgi:hypothetical protein
VEGGLGWRVDRRICECPSKEKLSVRLSLRG